MVSFVGFILIYTLGGITFLPLIGLCAIIYIKGGVKPFLSTLQAKKDEPFEISKDPENVIVKKGWIRLINQYQPKMPEMTNSSNGGIISGIQSYVSSNDNDDKECTRYKKGVVYAVLKHGTLFCFESEKQKEVVMILPMQDYKVSLFAPSIETKTDSELYGRTTVVCLTPTSVKEVNGLSSVISVETLSDKNITCYPTQNLYLTCPRKIDKEDWYFGLIEARHMLHETQQDEDGLQFEMIDNTRFDFAALEKLLNQVQSTPSHRETSWLNAILGRIFLSLYKTDRIKTYLETKIANKIAKTRKPTFLDEIKVRGVDVGDSMPFFTDPKLLSITDEGEVIVEFKLDYHGDLTIEIETDFNWSYSSRMKPIRMNLILAVQLKKLSGKMLLKLKAPPTNRLWTGFFELPEMKWKIKPVVADKHIKLNIITNAIESRIREVIAETMVLPNMNDIPFCSTSGMGGIFGDYEKRQVKIVQKESDMLFQKISKRTASTNSTNSTASTASSSSTGSSISNTSTLHTISEIPTTLEKHHAADTLKLEVRGAESMYNLTDDRTSNSTIINNNSEELLFESQKYLDTDADDNVSVSSTSRRSFASIRSSISASSKNILRRRSKLVSNEEECDSDNESSQSINDKSNTTNQLDKPSVKSTGSTSSKLKVLKSSMKDSFLGRKSNIEEKNSKNSKDKDLKSTKEDKDSKYSNEDKVSEILKEDKDHKNLNEDSNHKNLNEDNDSKNLNENDDSKSSYQDKDSRKMKEDENPKNLNKDKDSKSLDEDKIELGTKKVENLQDIFDEIKLKVNVSQTLPPVPLIKKTVTSSANNKSDLQHSDIIVNSASIDNNPVPPEKPVRGKSKVIVIENQPKGPPLPPRKDSSQISFKDNKPVIIDNTIVNHEDIYLVQSSSNNLKSQEQKSYNSVTVINEQVTSIVDKIPGTSIGINNDDMNEDTKQVPPTLPVSPRPKRSSQLDDQTPKLSNVSSHSVTIIKEKQSEKVTVPVQHDTPPALPSRH